MVIVSTVPSRTISRALVRLMPATSLANLGIGAVINVDVVPNKNETLLFGKGRPLGSDDRGSVLVEFAMILPVVDDFILPSFQQTAIQISPILEGRDVFF
jgi:hypothetical protein